LDLRILTTDEYNPFLKSGLLEFNQQGQWFQVCNSDWGSSESFVTCGQLGYPIAAENQRRR